MTMFHVRYTDNLVYGKYPRNVDACMYNRYQVTFSLLLDGNEILSYHMIETSKVD